LDSVTDRITIKDFLPNGMPAGGEIKVLIDSLFNPLSLNERDFPAMIGILSINDGNLYSVEEGVVAFSATKATSISNVEILADDHTVQEHVEF
jgi:hypothetical protein